MRSFTTLAFDECIAGTTGAWYTPAANNETFGLADSVLLQTITTDVSGTATLTCEVQHSGDGRNWVPIAAAPDINTVAISEGFTFMAGALPFEPVLLKFVRIKITLGGTSPQCRLKLYISGHVFQSFPPDAKPCGCS